MRIVRDKWAGLWYSRNRFAGVTRHFLFEDGNVALFKTRAAARKYIQEKYGYIRDRHDLRIEPHGWRVPSAVRVRVTIETIGGDRE